MGIADLLIESMGERSAAGEARQLERVIATASTHAERIKRVTEAYDIGKVSVDVYVAVSGMRGANVKPETATDFVRAITESLGSVPSRTVAAFEAYWRERGLSAKPDVDALFESLYEACKDEDEEEDDAETDQDGAEEEGEED